MLVEHTAVEEPAAVSVLLESEPVVVVESVECTAAAELAAVVAAQFDPEPVAVEVLEYSALVSVLLEL